MTNPDRWLQSCTDDYTDEEGDHFEMLEQEWCEVIREISAEGVNKMECEIFDKLFDEQSNLMKALAQNDDATALVILRKAFDQEVQSMVNSRMEY